MAKRQICRSAHQSLIQQATKLLLCPQKSFRTWSNAVRAVPDQYVVPKT